MLNYVFLTGLPGLVPEHVSGAENGAEQAKTGVEWSRAVSGSQKKGVERGAERCRAGTEQGAD